MPPLLSAHLEAALALTPADYDAGRASARQGRMACAALFDEVDLLLTYAAPGEAPAGLSSTGDSRFNRLWTLMGVPCVTIPVQRGPRDLPVGIQLIARFGADDRVLAVAKALEQVLA